MAEGFDGREGLARDLAREVTDAVIGADDLDGPKDWVVASPMFVAALRDAAGAGAIDEWLARLGGFVRPYPEDQERLLLFAPMVAEAMSETYPDPEAFGEVTLPAKIANDPGAVIVEVARTVAGALTRRLAADDERRAREDRTGNVALDAQLRLLDWWSRPSGIRYAAGFVASHMRKDMPLASDAEITLATERFLELESKNLDAGSTFYVTKEMADVAAFASRSLPPDSVFTEDTLAEWPNGFMVIEGGLLVVDEDGRISVVRAISWGEAERPADLVFPGLRGSGVTFYSDGDDPRETQHGEIREQLRKIPVRVPREVLFHVTAIEYGDRVGEWDGAISDATRALIESNDAGYGTDVPVNVFSWVMAAWLLMGQPVSTVREHHAPRPLARRARGTSAPEPGMVQVVTLRRSREAGEGHSDREAGEVLWSHRWMVRGHWRKIVRKDGTPDLIWVNPYVKGPEDRPFIAKDKVFAWTR